MSPQDLHQTAVFLRERYSPPSAGMLPGKYVSHEAMHALADALDRTGDVVAEQPQAGPQTADDAYLRREAVDFALRSASGRSSAADTVAAAEVIHGFLRGDAPSRAAQEDAAWAAKSGEQNLQLIEATARRVIDRIRKGADPGFGIGAEALDDLLRDIERDFGLLQ